MRRIAIVTALVGVGVLAARALAPRLHARMLAACEHMFDEMPDNFPPKRMLGGIEAARANTARILELLEAEPGEGKRVSLDAARSVETDETEMVVA